MFYFNFLSSRTILLELKRKKSQGRQDIQSKNYPEKENEGLKGKGHDVWTGMEFGHMVDEQPHGEDGYLRKRVRKDKRCGNPQRKGKCV